jgi:MFS family permease
MLAIVGATSNICMVTNRTLLQMNCDAPYLGRVMSAYMMMFGLTQLGTIPLGAFADRFGVPVVLAVLGALFVLAIVLTWVMQPRIRKLD